MLESLEYRIEMTIRMEDFSTGLYNDKSVVVGSYKSVEYRMMTLNLKLFCM